MSEIFLSYKSEDRPRAKIIAEALEQQGYSVWWDMTIPPGKTFDEVIEKALDSAKCVVVLWSRKSVLSDWVKEEASVAVKRRILLPVLIDDVKIPIGFKRIQAARLVDWQGTLPNPEFDLLLKSVAEIVGRKEPLEVPNEVIIPTPIEIGKTETKIKKIEFGTLQVLKHAMYEGTFMIRRCAIGGIRVLKCVLSDGGVSKWLKLYAILWIPWAAFFSLVCLVGIFSPGEDSFFYNLFMVITIFLIFVIMPFLPIYFLSKHR